MKRKISNLSAILVLISFVVLISAFILESQTTGMFSGLGIVVGVTVNTVINSLKTIKVS